MPRPTVLLVTARKIPGEVRAVLHAAREVGYDVALLATGLPAGSREFLADWEIVDIHDRDAAVAAGLALARRASVEGVAPCTDVGVEVAAAIASELGLPGSSPEAAHRARHKHAMRSALEHRPDLIPAFARVTSLDEFEQAVASIGAPGVLKPVGAGGSKGVLQLGDDSDLAGYWRHAQEVISPDVDPRFGLYAGQYIYEERLGGSEHSAEGFVHGGEVHVAGITDKWVTDPHYVEYREIHPSALPPSAQERIVDLARTVVEALGIDSCAFHLECRRLPDGTVKLLEIAARPAAGFITSHLIPMSTGIPFCANFIRVATGQAPDMQRTRSLYAGRHGILARTAGRFDGIDGVEEILRLWEVEHFFWEQPAGAEIVLPPYAAWNVNLASVIARASRQEDVVAVLDESERLARPRLTPAVAG